MPYSLNEDTGLVSVPIEPGALPDFRVWQANLHLVAIRDNWREEITENDQDNIVAFLDALKTLETEEKNRSNGPSRSILFLPDREKTLSQYGERLSGLQATGEVERARGLLASDDDMSEQLLMEGLGYAKRRATLSTAASERQIYFHPKGWFFVDVFFDKLLVANHPLDFRGRLELDSTTISPTDLLLQKLQIVNISDKDVKDAIVLLVAHGLVETDATDTINGAYIARLLSRDWGFWYTVTTNLTGLKELLPQMEALTDDERHHIGEQVDGLLAHIEAAPKTLSWKARAKIGPRVRWYEPVETMDTVAGFGIWRLREEPTRKKG